MWPFQRQKLSDVSLEVPLEELRKRARIAVVDDDLNAFPLRVLVREGYAIDYFPSVTQLDPFERGLYDIIFLDIAGVAPEWSEDDGLAVLEHLKERNPAQVIVAFSGQTFDLSKSRFWKLADDTLSKPVDAMTAKRCIDDLLARTMTPNHYWGGVRALLLSEGVPEREIASIESAVVRAVTRRTRPDVRGVVERVCANAETIAKVAALVAKIAGLLGPP